MSQLNPFKLLILDLAPVPEGSTLPQAFAHSLELARLDDVQQFHRSWLAEHHYMTEIARTAASVLIGYPPHILNICV